MEFRAPRLTNLPVKGARIDFLAISALRLSVGATASVSFASKSS
jgi:hypothetical protein